MTAMLCMLSLNLMKQCKLLVGLSQLANIWYVDKCWAKLKLVSITASKMQIYNYKVDQHILLSDPVPDMEKVYFCPQANFWGQKMSTT